MSSTVEIVGIFDSDADAARCLKGLCRMQIPVENIYVSGVHSKHLRAVAGRLLTVPLESRVVSTFGLSGAVMGSIFMLGALILSPPWGLAHALGLFTCIGLGAILGCMSGTLLGAVAGSVLSEFPANVREGRLTGNQVLISVRLPKGNSEQQVIRSIMQECQAANVAIEEGGSPAGGTRLRHP